MTAGSARHAIEPRVSTKATPTCHRPADRPQAIADIAVHIQRLWEPRMRRRTGRTPHHPAGIVRGRGSKYVNWFAIGSARFE
ncbi:formate dehydrogenase subunit delta [Variovorax sp. J22P240]|uniref:formate dehydrogenase subunit delta n=1 Tax=Variovorax sp. J22P240 TaxID=3053514 RepID=UPI003365ADBF